MNILLIGSGGREHALARAISSSDKCEKLFISPGNGGTSQCGENISLPIGDSEAMIKFCQENSIRLVLVGPEQPLVDGLADHLRGAGIPVVGPGAKGAVLEGSKEFSKEFMQRHNIPTAGYKSFNADEIQAAKDYVANLPTPIVVKASGLAAGKGVLICETNEDAANEVEKMLSGSSFGDSGTTVVIEEFLTGIEMSVFVLTDGTAYVTLPNAKDYKRIGEGDTGLNTGGMGAVSPVPFANEELMSKVDAQIIRPTLDGLRKEDIPYRGFIFFGLMITDGNPYVIEYNVRMGDPETEVVMPRVESDVVELFSAAANGNLAGHEVTIKDEACATVMLVSGGYPGKYEKGKEITGVEEVKDSLVFHAGTKMEDGKLLTNGGRVIAVSSFGKTPHEAVAKSYANIGLIFFAGKYFRRDIGTEFIPEGA